MLPVGKLDVNTLENLLRKYVKKNDQVLLGPKIGEDAAVVKIGETVLVVSTDPITFATDEIGYYSVVVNANDVASCGIRPRWFSVTVLLPEYKENEKMADRIFKQIHDACEKFNISLIGGHTEITHDINRPIVVGQMIGQGIEKSLITTGGAKPGDMVLMTKGVCVEGTSVIAREKEEFLLAHGISRRFVNAAKKFLFDPGISIVEEACLASDSACINSMHDITEGGLANGLNEIAMASGVEIEVEFDKILFFEETKIICDALGLDPLGVIGSGSLLATAAMDEAEKLLKKAREAEMIFNIIGQVRRFGSPMVTMVKPEGSEKLPYYQRDEIVKIF
ncbi:AIR synthase family protein [Thermodesulfobacteriota bacterium]